MTNGKIAAILFEVGIILCLVSMVLGPLDIVNPSIAAAAAGGFLALAGLPFAFRSWTERAPAAAKEELPYGDGAEGFAEEEMPIMENKREEASGMAGTEDAEPAATENGGQEENSVRTDDTDRLEESGEN